MGEYAHGNYGEPWEIGPHDDILDKNGGLIAYDEGELRKVDNRGNGLTRGRRIVACVNELAGKPEGYVGQLEAERDKLRAELDDLKSFIEPILKSHDEEQDAALKAESENKRLRAELDEAVDKINNLTKMAAFKMSKSGEGETVEYVQLDQVLKILAGVGSRR